MSRFTGAFLGEIDKFENLTGVNDLINFERFESENMEPFLSKWEWL